MKNNRIATEGLRRRMDLSGRCVSQSKLRTIVRIATEGLRPGRIYPECVSLEETANYCLHRERRVALPDEFIRRVRKPE